jgi:hypothetical protein
MSPSDQYIYRRYEYGDEEEILELFQEVFGDWGSGHRSSPLDYWRWKYLDNPFLKQMNIEKPLTYVCEYNGNIIGITNSYLVRYKIGSKISLAHYGGDAAVQVNHRGKGVTRNLSNIRDKELTNIGVELGIATSGNPIFIAQAKRRGYPPFPYTVMTYVKIDDINEYMRHINSGSLIQRFGYLAISKFLQAVNFTKRMPEKIYEVETWDRFDESADVFWDKIKSKYLFILERKQGYLNWKYCDPRRYKFTIRGIKRDGEVIGYSVLRINDDGGYISGILEDLVSDFDGTSVAESLVVDALDFFDAHGVDMVMMRVIKGHPFADILGRCGFVDSRARPHVSFLLYRDASEDFRLFMKCKPWQIHYVFCDHDTG